MIEKRRGNLKELKAKFRPYKIQERQLSFGHCYSSWCKRKWNLFHFTDSKWNQFRKRFKLIISSTLNMKGNPVTTNHNLFSFIPLAHPAIARNMSVISFSSPSLRQSLSFFILASASKNISSYSGLSSVVRHPIGDPIVVPWKWRVKPRDFYFQNIYKHFCEAWSPNVCGERSC